jgi:very-short-patch-repair endonuclease
MKLNEAKLFTARERIARLFRFMGAMQQLSAPPSFQLKTYSWKLRLADLGNHKNVTVGKISTGEEDSGDDFILRVKRPAEKGSPVAALFDRLLELNNTIERESEKVELVVGDGILKSEGPDGGVEHPLLLQKLQLEFLADSAEIIIRETDREAELYTPLLRKLGASEEQVQQCRLALQSAGCHPLGGTETTNFLKQVFAIVWPAGSGLTPPAIRRDAFFYLGPRSAGFSQAIEAYLESLPSQTEFPSSLVRVVGIDPGPSTVSPEDVDLLLTMPSNPEQDRVARRLSSTGAVLVQGPPGTGKTHTIANLIGHLLAQGKSILVTSHASKALRIVRDMVTPELRPLCVSVLEQESESRDQLEAAVKGIVNRFTSSDPEELEGLATQYGERRVELLDRLTQLENKLLEARLDEYRPVVVGSESVHPARAAQLLMDPSAHNHNWLPGPLTSAAAMPLTQDEVRQLYRLNREVPVELETDLERRLPPVEELIPDYEFRELVARKRQLQSGEAVGDEFWEHETQEPRQLTRLVEMVEKAVAPINEGSPWTLDCMRVSVLGGAHKQTWEDLVTALEKSLTEFAELERRVLASGVSVECDLPLEEQIRTTQDIIAHLKTKGSIGMWTFINSSWKKVIAGVRIHGKNQLRTAEDAEGVLALLQLEQGQQVLRTRWDRQMGTKGAPKYGELGEPAHEVAYGYVGQIKAALAWHDTEWEACRRVMREVGLRWSAMVDRVPIDTGLYGELLRIKETVRRFLLPTVQSRKSDLDSEIYDVKLRAQERALGGNQSGDLGGILGRLRIATATMDVEGYARCWAWLVQLNSLREPVERRNQLLARLQEAAPEWANQIRRHIAPHDRAEPPGDAVLAWKFRQWLQQLDERTQIDLDQLQQEVLHLKSSLRLATAQYVENRTWANQLRRTGVRQQQALVGWLDLMRKIGSGKGKRAPKLKAAAREKLAECRDAVPVWIMPLARVAESYHPGEFAFDVVILDEASQCDVTGLLAFALGKEVLVVGDNEQVSPEAVGMSYEKIEALIEEHLYDIPNKELYDGKTSVYDLARQSFGGTIRLIEHFRCVPEIIAFSNKLCYQGEIQPLRETTKVRLRPPTIFHKVDGSVYQRKINRNEVEEVASLLVSCSEQPEYKGQTFGVISMVGEEQALAIDKLLLTHLSLPDYQERRVLCGNAAQFQGDERDVMFLSLVENADDSGALTMRRTEVFTKRFNVAASRARNQLWVVSSLDPDQDLKPGDLREALIRHAQDPSKTMRELDEMRAATRSSSEDQGIGEERRLTRTLRQKLEEKGYPVHANYKIGNYQLDLVVGGPAGRIAIKCDGDQDNAPDRFKLAVEREAVLERLGWRFLRLRASQFYLKPQETLQAVIKRLENLDIHPNSGADRAQLEDGGRQLNRRVLERAAQLRRIWKGEESPSAPAPAAEVVVASPPVMAAPGSHLFDSQEPAADEPHLRNRLAQRMSELAQPEGSPLAHPPSFSPLGLPPLPLMMPNGLDDSSSLGGPKPESFFGGQPALRSSESLEALHSDIPLPGAGSALRGTPLALPEPPALEPEAPKPRSLPGWKDLLSMTRNPNAAIPPSEAPKGDVLPGKSFLPFPRPKEEEPG